MPVGTLQPGSYTLELFDKDLKEVRLFRRVRIPSGTDQSSHGKAQAKQLQGRTIALDAIYSTSTQKGLKYVSGGFHLKNDGTMTPAEPYSAAWEKIRRQDQTDTSNVLLVRGDGITAAIAATAQVFTAGHSADEPVSADQRSKSQNYWLVAYLGAAGSEPPQWLIKEAQIARKDIRLRYREKEPGIVTTDLHRYFAWVPLGTLDPGTYTVELFDEEFKHVTLMRRVTIPKNRNS